MPRSLADDFRVRPGTMISVDSIAPNHHGGPYRLVQYDLAGNVLDMLVLVDLVGLDIPSGVTVLGGDVFVCGPGRIVAQVDLQTGELHHPFVTDFSGVEAMTNLDGDLLIGTYKGHIERRDREGRERSEFQLSTDAGISGMDTDGTLLYVGSYNDGDVHVFDLTGNLQHIVPTGIGAHSLSGLSFDGRSQTLWITTGFGSDELRQYDLAGNLLLSLPVGLPFLNGVDVVDHALILNAEPNFAIGGDTLRFQLEGGAVASPFAHFVSSVGGSPFFLRLRSGSFPAGGVDEWDVLLPPGLAPLVIGHTAFARDAMGGVLVSNEEKVFHH